MSPYDISAVMSDHESTYRPRVLGWGDICHLNTENQGSSQVSGSSRNSGMQIEISLCRHTHTHTAPRQCSPLHTRCVRACVCISRVYAYIIYRTAPSIWRTASGVCYCQRMRWPLRHNCCGASRSAERKLTRTGANCKFAASYNVRTGPFKRDFVIR